MADQVTPPQQNPSPQPPASAQPVAQIPVTSPVPTQIPAVPLKWYFITLSVILGLTGGYWGSETYEGKFLGSFLAKQRDLLTGDDLSQPKTGFNYLHNLKKFPEELLVNPGIYEVIHFFGGRITTLPNMAGFSNLRSLVMVNTSLRTIPSDIGNLSGLTELDLGGNNLKEVPDTIGNLVSLKKLYLYENNLKKVPEQISSLVNLEILDLHGNNLTAVPDSLGALSGNLRILYLGGNKISPEVRQKISGMLPNTQIYY